ncbi:isopenicillin N synthase family dioxygenase [Aspergillus novofumigatus IBT 16806]|uniref:Clavaminate synthase-like protein n=1 Tax=Aspergillus novofumigatus (strain IBT 16806) TaxID=1392255 RepID=A0A2I1CF51_ASPN1|nr:Clavaminate synthase-like protein [Aspergillus novofumigatus IBT 16806]PKX96252.1 Clavaminate synthase-like protein [Aspergillus novofumigatus IBT 16806]
MSSTVTTASQPSLHLQGVDFKTIPIIDLSKLHSSNVEERRELAREIDQACTKVGFFYIKNHGISEELIKKTYEAAHRFFDLAEGEKMKVYLGNSKNFRGYSPLYGERSSNPDLEEAALDKPPGALSEAFDIGYELSGDLRKGPGDQLPRDDFGLLGENQWPEESLIPGFRVTYLRYFAEALELARALMRIFALALGQKEDFFDPMVRFPGVTSRMLHYPPQPVQGQEIPGLAAHTDYECFTILAQDSVPALQVLNNRGEWVLAPPIPGTLIVNISDTFSFWSNKRFKSTIHRVANLSGEERYSIPFFFGVDYNSTISVLENQVSEDNPPCKEPFKAGEYVRWKLSKAYIGYGGEPAGKSSDA